MRSTRGVLVLVALLVCGSVAVLAGEGAVIERANGGYQWTIAEDDIFGIEVGNTITVNARKFDDGSIRGVFEYNQVAFGQSFRFNVSVTCFNVYDGNRAKVGGVVEVSNDPTLPAGVFAWFQALDNGEGSQSTADESTLVGFGTEQENEDFCNSAATPRFGPWEVTGNLQVED